MRILLLTVAFFFCTGAQAQLRLGAQLGVSRVNWTAADASATSSGESYSASGLNNLQGGLVGQLTLSGAWQLRTGLLLVGKGASLYHQSYRDTSTLNIWLRYLELPLTLVYQHSLGGKTKGFAGGGLYGAYGYNGVAKGEGKDDNYGLYDMHREVEFSRDNETSVFPPVIAPFDYGYTFQAGIEHHKLQFLLSYSQGLKALLNPKLFYGSYKNRVLSLSAAYLISTKRK